MTIGMTGMGGWGDVYMAECTPICMHLCTVVEAGLRTLASVVASIPKEVWLTKAQTG